MKWFISYIKVLMQYGTICWVREAKRFGLSGQVSEREMWGQVCGLGRGEGEESHEGVRQKAKAQFLLALMPIFIPSLLACYMRTCNDISRRCGGGLGGTLSWAYMITGRRDINLPPRLVTQHSQHPWRVH